MTTAECWDVGWYGALLKIWLKNQNEKNYEQIKSINMVN